MSSQELTYLLNKPFASELHSIWVTFTEKEREKEAPAETTVSTTGELVDNPMSTYTEISG